MLERTSIAINAANLDGFRQGLRELGYIEAKNFLIEYRSADGRDERFPDLATELVRLKVDLILTRGTPAALAAKNATGTIPVVMTGIGDPVGQGIVVSLARPGGNVTGLSATTTDIYAKRVELLKELVPGAARLAAIYASTEFAGALLSYGVNYPDLYRRAASFADKIFKGAKPADIPVEQPIRYELVINMKTAEAIGVTIPPSLLLRADRVIQ